MTTHAVRPDTEVRCPTAVWRALMVLLLLGGALFLAVLFAGSAHADESDDLPPALVTVWDAPAPAPPKEPVPGAVRSATATEATDTAAEPVPTAPGPAEADPTAPGPAEADPAAPGPAEAVEGAPDRAPVESSLPGIADIARVAEAAPRVLEPVVTSLTDQLPPVRVSLPSPSPPSGQAPAEAGDRAEDHDTGTPDGRDRAAAERTEREDRSGEPGFGPPVPDPDPLAERSSAAERATAPPPAATAGPGGPAGGDGHPSPFPSRDHTADPGRCVCDQTPRGVDQPTALPTGHPLLSGEDQPPTGPDHPLRDRPHGVLALPG
ncbi:hypothetical protein [Streptomyces sp. NBC_01803]|uniref:hypothetical protein n=1 Tax=Streptomyces sp. NBC_01803 TaxID=2975946 RepID=UPI002DDA95A3|nr:hypothetical protein [Streptomyces sp. NBC_01803]WSA46252.1 hypothetical protein OIE51_19915 [Streptomyces sp. NBC_01803]